MISDTRLAFTSFAAARLSGWVAHAGAALPPIFSKPRTPSFQEVIMSIRRTISALSIIGVFAAAGQANAAGPPAGLDVNVTNGPTNPVPVTGTMTGSVTGTVGLSPDASVFVNNPPSDPVLVRSVNDAIQPVQATTKGCLTDRIGCAQILYRVPAGKRLVIEYASMRTCALPGTTVLFSIGTQVGGVFANHHFNVTPPASALGATPIQPLVDCNAVPSSLVSVGQQVRLYSDAGSVVTAEAGRTPIIGKMDADFTFSGYLVDVPLSP